MFQKMMNKIRNNKFTVLITVFVVSLITITLGSALLNSVLTLTGNTKIKNFKWNIHFEFVDEIEASNPNSDSSKDARITDATTKKENINFSTNFIEVGDKYEFTVYTWNEGDGDAMIDSVEYNMPDEYKNNISFKAYYDDDEITEDATKTVAGKTINIYNSKYNYEKIDIENCDPLYAKSMRKIRVIARYDKKIENLTEDKNINFNFKINYVQLGDCPCEADGTCPAVKSHLLRIRPNGGIYNNKEVETRLYVEEGKSIKIGLPKRNLYNFINWEVIHPTSGTYTFEKNEQGEYIFTMGHEKVIIEARWEQGDYVARIMNKYYTSIQTAFDDVDSKNWEDNTVWLLKDTTEYPTNTAQHAFKFNLDGHKVTGTIQNNRGSNITLINGSVQAESPLSEEELENLPLNKQHKAAFINYGTLTLGENEGRVDIENSISLIGNESGLINKNNNGAVFRFYDGFVEGEIAIDRGRPIIPDNYMVFVEHKNSNNHQKAYLVPEGTRAVVRTNTDGFTYANLQDAINSVERYKEDTSLTDNDYIISAIRDFEAAYTVTVKAKRVFFDLDGFDVETGESITNNGYFKIYNSSSDPSKISPSVTITNKNELIIDNVNIKTTTDSNTIDNEKKLTVLNSTIEGTKNYAINNKTGGTINTNTNTIIKSDSTYGLNNDSDVLVLKNGNVYGLKNNGTVTISDNTKLYNNSYESHGNTFFVEALTNNGVVNMTGGSISSDNQVTPVTNNNTINMTGGIISSSNITIDNKGTINANGGEITSSVTAITGGTVNVNKGNITSTTGPTIKDANVTISDGKITSTDGIAINNGTATVNGGTVTGTTAIDTTSLTVSGGTITGKENGAITNDLNMTGGSINATSGTGLTINGVGTITAGAVNGDLYGVKNNNKLTLGVDDGSISVETPIIKGTSYGLVIAENADTNFYDGILKGTIDGYTSEISATPTGSVIVDGTEIIDEVLYQTDYLTNFENWLRVGDVEYNSTDAASRAIESEGTIYVIKNANVSFAQHILDENKNKNITFDLNGYTVRTTQPIYNQTTTTIVDSSEGQTGNIYPRKNSSVVNDAGNTLILDGGKYYSNVEDVFKNKGTMRVENAYFDVDNTTITNYNKLVINNINVARSKDGIRQDGIEDENLIIGYTVMNNGIINASENGLETSRAWYQNYDVTFNNGKIIAGENGIYGSNGTKTVNGGEIIAGNDGINSSDSDTVINAGKITGDNNGITSKGPVIINGGEVTGKNNGIEMEFHSLWVGSKYEDVTINNGTIKGQTQNGILSPGSKLYIYGGEISGKIDGVTNTGETILGKNDFNISVEKPKLLGYTKYGLESTGRISFYDGILIGKIEGYSGLVESIPEATSIKDDEDYYIDRVQYDARYLEGFGDWLGVMTSEGEKTFSTIKDAYDAVEGNSGTIYVIKDTYVNFAQMIPNGKDIVFDLRGHSVTMTQPLSTTGKVTMIDSEGNGLLKNINDNTIDNTGELTIESGKYTTDSGYSISNSNKLIIKDGLFENTVSNGINASATIKGGKYKDSNSNGLFNLGTMIIDDADIKSKTGINNSGTLTINGVKIEVPNVGINNSGTLTINNANVKSNSTGLSQSGGTVIINDITLKSNDENGINIGRTNKFEINKGTIEGYLNGIVNNSLDNVTINDGLIVGYVDAGILNNGKIVLLGGTIEGNTNGVDSKNNTILGTDDSQINIDSPSLKGNLYGVNIIEGTVTFNDGILKGTAGRYTGTITDIPNNTQIFFDTETIEDREYLTAYLKAEQIIAENLNQLENGQTKKYSNLQTAFEEAHDNDTIQLLTNAPLYYDVVNTKNITFNLNDYSISTNKKITNTGTIKIINNQNGESIIKSTSGNFIFNEGEMTLNNVTIKNNGSRNYVINNSGLLKTETKTVIESLSGVYNSGEMIANNSTFNCTNNAIDNRGKLTVNKGTYKGSYSLYSSTTNNVLIENATFNGPIYNAGNNSTTMNNVILNGNLQNNTSNLLTYRSTLNSTINNNGTANINETTINGSISNYSNMVISNSEVNTVGSNAIVTSGTLNINSLTNINVGTQGSNSNYIGITQNGGSTIVDKANIRILGGYKSTGVYVDNDNATFTILDGKIDVNSTREAYGAYINRGTFVMGEKDTSSASGTNLADVSITNPEVRGISNEYGIGVKKENGFFRFFDGKIWGSRYSKPDTTSEVEYLWEATTYADDETGYEFTILEWMGNNYSENHVARINNTFYETIQSAVNAASSGDEIIMLKSTNENFTVPSTKNVKLNIKNHTITGQLKNEGTINVYNGTINNFEKSTVINSGTFIMGFDDETLEQSSIRILSNFTAVENEGTFAFYDGYIEGKVANTGSINLIPNLTRVHLTKSAQSEKKFLQSLREEDIISGETDLILTIDPNGGYYEERNVIQEVYVKYHVPYELSVPEREGCDFMGWETADPSVINDNIVTPEVRDITVRAIWKVREDTVARIGENYYSTLASAISHAKTGDLIELLKDTTEDATNNKDVTIDLGGFTVTGAFINTGTLRLINGTIENKYVDGIGLVNKKTLILGVNDDNVSTTSVKIIGDRTGLRQDGKFEFYDGYVEGKVAINGIVDKVPAGYSVFVDHIDSNNHQRAYLTGTPDNAVAETRVGQSQFFFNLNDAVQASALTGYEVFIIRNFEMPYTVTAPVGSNIKINLEGHTIQTANNFVNDGKLLIYDNTDGEKGKIVETNSIINNGELTIKDIVVDNTGNIVALKNTGDLILDNSQIYSVNQYAVNNSGTITMDDNSLLKATKMLALYNSNPDGLTIDKGTIGGIETTTPLVLNKGTIIDTTWVTTNDSQYRTAILLNGTNASVVSNDVDYNASYAILNYKNNTSGNNIEFNKGNYSFANNTVLFNIPDNSNIVFNNVEMNVNYHLISNPRYATITFNNCKMQTKYSLVTAGTNTSSVYKKTVIVNGGEYISNSSDYALFVINGGTDAYLSTLTINDGAKIIQNGSSNDRGAIWLEKNGSLILNDGEIIAGNIGVNCTNNNQFITMNGGKIESDNIGINVQTINKMNINKGIVKGDTYGIYIITSSGTITIGNTEDTLVNNNPYISGGTYGLYANDSARNNVTFNFYNGVFRGSAAGHNVEITNQRTKTDEIVVGEEKSEEQINNTKTELASDVSSSPEPTNAKSGNGYARITYIGNTTDECTNGTTMDYDYTGEEKLFNTPCTGKYKLEVWGAQGGSRTNNNKLGGYGGYSVGEITLNKDEKLYINVGGQGIERAIVGNSSYSCDNSEGRQCLGGYNGGGYSSASGASGGGATHIAFKSGLLNTLENDKNKVIIVAGGGGGASYNNSNYNGNGGSAGGFIGENGKAYNTNNGKAGLGGKQDKGGTPGNSYNGKSGTFGQGGNGIQYSSGGGGGFYGGGSGLYAGGGGGSSYIGNSRLSNKTMYAYNATLVSDYVLDYLVNKDAFLQVGDNTYNNFEDAVEAVTNNETIYVINDAKVKDISTISSNKDIVIDMQGHTLIMQTIINESNLSIIDSSTGKTGTINSVGESAIDNKSNLSISDLTITSNKKGINVTSGEGSITLNNTNITVTNYGLYVTQPYNITINNSTVYHTNTNYDSLSILINSNGGVFNTNNLTSKKISIIGTANNKIESIIKNSNIKYNNTALTTSNSNLKIDNSKITQENYTGDSSFTLSCTNNSKCTIEGNAEFNGVADYNVKVVDSELIMNNGTITGKGLYGLYLSNSTATINGGTVKYEGSSNSSASSAIAVYNYSTLNVNGGTIESVNDGVNSWSYSNVNVNGGTISGQRNGISITRGETHINNGTVIGSDYGLYAEDNNAYIGKTTDTLSTEKPSVEGGTFAVFGKGNTYVYFYNGRLKGTTNGYNDEFKKIRPKKQVYTEDVIDENDVTYKVQYLVDLDAFLQVGANTYDNFEDAIAAITDDSGTIKVLNNAVVYDPIVFPTGKTITLDLNNHKLTTTDTITSNGDIIITDLSTAKGGILDNKVRQNSITAIKNITVENAQVKSAGTAIYTSGATAGTITLNNANITATDGINNRSKHRITIANSVMNVTNIGVTVEGGATVGGDISNTTINAGKTGIYLNSGNNDIYNITNCTVDAETAISSYGSGKRTINVNGGTYSATGKSVYFGSAASTLNLIKGTFTSTSSDSYVIHNKMGTMNIEEDVLISSESSGGVLTSDSSATLVLNNPRIEISGSNKIGLLIGAYQTVTINNARIKTTGKESTGIIIAPSNYSVSVTINNVDIKSEHVGMEVNGNTNYSVDIKNANIKGSTYGIYQKGLKINYGSPDDELSTTNPYTEGELYGLYKTGGTFNFYSGRIKGYVKSYEGTIEGIREAHEIFNEYDYDLPSEVTSIRTYSTTTYSSDATSNTPKAGNGYARITFKKSTGTSTDSCNLQEGESIDYDYLGSEQTFTATCPGTYILEVWGAQGGGSISSGSARSGAGAYATGEINLSSNEQLFINVGGQGTGENTAGGYNGGGSSSYYSTSGGGATHIATKTGLLSTLENDKDKVLIVAGGGAGLYSCGYPCSYVYRSGGSGGGYEGNKGYGNESATQNSGYSFGQGENGYSGGGGGFYGGFNYGGGSGYTANPRLSHQSMYGYNVTPRYSSEFSDIAYLIPANEFVYNENLNKRYINLQTAIDEAGSSDILKITSDKSISNDLNIISNKKVSIDLQGHTLVINKQILNKGELNIISNSQNKAIISSQLSNQVINNQGKLNINNVEFNSRQYLTNSSDGIITLNNVAITTTEKSIVNNGSITMDGVDITSSKTAIDNVGTLDIDNSTINANDYGIYDNSEDNNSVIKNSEITTNSNSIYINKSGKYVINKTDLVGNIYLYQNNGGITINESNINGYINSKGTLTIKDSNITKNGIGEGILIKSDNSGSIITLENNNIHLSSTYYSTAVSSTGTIISKNNTYTINKGTTISSSGEFTSIGDTIDSSSDGSTIALKNSSEKSISNLTLTINGNFTSETKAININTGGNVTITNSNIDVLNGGTLSGLYISNSSTNVVIDSTNINTHHETVKNTGYGVYVKDGNITIKDGTIKSYNNVTSYGLYIDSGTVDTASITLGILDGSGLENADISTTNPHIEAVGSTTGIGIKTNRRTFNYYDGIIIGSTSSRVEGEFISHSEKNYEPYVVTNTTTNNQEMTLKFMAS